MQDEYPGWRLRVSGYGYVGWRGFVSSAQILRRDVACTVKHPYDLRAACRRLIKHDVVSNGKAANSATKLRALAARLRVVGEHEKSLAYSIEQPISSTDVVGSNEKPDLIEISLGPRTF